MAQTHGLRNWGFGGGLIAAVFAVWMFAFPELAVSHFAWPVEPRMSQIFIGAGYVFRTAFFLSVALEPMWTRVRWIFWGNLVFTGTLLLATFWHLDRFTWSVPTVHVWILLYISEPIAMLYLVPRGAARDAPVTTPRGPVRTGLRVLLVVKAATLLTFGLLLVLNPEFADLRWPWPLNPLDARIMAAWLLGWATWAGTLAFARDWDEVRLAAALNILFGVVLLAASLIFRDQLDFSRVTAPAFLIMVAALTVSMIFFYWRQEQARPRA